MTITQPIQLPLFPGLAGTGTAFFLPGQDKAFVAPHAFGHHLNDSYDTPTTSGRLLLSPSREACMVYTRYKRTLWGEWQATHRAKKTRRKDIEDRIATLVAHGNTRIDVNSSHLAEVKIFPSDGPDFMLFKRGSGEQAQWFIRNRRDSKSYGGIYPLHIQHDPTIKGAQKGKMTYGGDDPILPNSRIQWADGYIIFLPTAIEKIPSHAISPHGEDTRIHAGMVPVGDTGQKTKTKRPRTQTSGTKAKTKTSRARTTPPANQRTNVILEALNYFAIPLDVPFTNTETARTIFRTIVRECHPDLYRNTPVKIRLEKTSQFNKATAAYEALTDFFSAAKSRALLGKTPREIIATLYGRSK